MTNVPEIFASMVFNDDVMKNKLPHDVYKSLHRTIERGNDLDINLANVVANAMKDWAIEKGATHFTHWFQPLTGITAEKHDSFIVPQKDGNVIMDFSGKELIKGEPDASSFPSGGLRATFEARGYTAWDPTSYAFIKDGSLCIPSVFCSHGGHTLDKKTPLLRSMEAINTQALRVLKLFGNESVRRVNTTIGSEQEYFLIDKELYDKRADLLFCGRTLFGARPPKGQEMEDHYFGAIKPRIAAFMKELDTELWKLGVLAKTKHNEAAPAQHELAPVYTTTNIATDHNQLTMELMKKIAERHGLVCLLHEKPFAGVNGSGKHNNWSLSTDKGTNLLEPGTSPYENAQFLLFLCSVIKAVDEYQDLLRVSAAGAGNDHRLGASEAPPAIISIFLGDELTAILDAIETGKVYDGHMADEIEIGVHTLPHFPKDSTDRNRTSPFAFTGNKFEFRMIGSSQSIADSNIFLNTAVAEELRIFADRLEGAQDFGKELKALIKETIKEHKRILFSGDGYSDTWQAEAEKRGLLNLKNSVEAIPYFSHEKNISLFERHKILTAEEIKSRQDILLDTYSKTINIEALTMTDMVRKNIIPAVTAYITKLSQSAVLKKQISDELSCEVEVHIINKLSLLSSSMYKKLDALEKTLLKVKEHSDDILDTAKFYRDNVFAAMQELRATVDEIEINMSQNDWPFPTYADLLFKI